MIDYDILKANWIICSVFLFIDYFLHSVRTGDWRAVITLDMRFLGIVIALIMDIHNWIINAYP